MNFKDYEKAIPQDFKSDGCTLAPDGTWGSCCRIHDYARQDRTLPGGGAEADRMLRDCLVERAPPFIARLYYWWVCAQRNSRLTPWGMVSIIGMLTAIVSLVAYSKLKG